MNIKDIARLANVSVSTVSKVMNQKDSSISQETRDRVLKIAKEYHYIPYASVILPHVKTFQIGVLFRSMENAHTTLCGIISEARARGYAVSVLDSENNSEEELKAISMFCKIHVDALLWEPLDRETEEENPQCTAQLEEAGIPFFLFNSSSKDSFHIDYSQISYSAVETLLAKGHQNIACLLSQGHRTPGFFEGYRKSLFDHQIPFSEDLVFHHVSDTLFYEIINHHISGVICSHFATALKLFGRCSGLHYQAPNDFSIISAKDDSRYPMEYPKISTYSIPRFQFGTFLCQKIIDVIENKEAPEKLFLTDVHLDNTSTIDIPSSMREKKITVVGSINIDHYLNLDQLPSSGKTVRTAVSSQYPGGKGTNEAIGAAKLGHHAALLGNVGDDVDSNLIYDALNEAAVDTRGLHRCSNHQTGKAFILAEKGGDSLISILSGANETLSPEDLKQREQLFENTGYALISTEIPMETVKAACQLTKKYGGQTIVKPAACSHMPKSVLENIDILIPNLNEINELVPHKETLSQQASYFLDCGVQIVIVTLGAKGCFLKTPDYEKYFPAENFVTIDNTGAGDAFISAFASYLLYGYPLEQAIRIAGYAAGFSITREGVVPSLIDKSTLEAYILRKEPELLTIGF